MNEGAEQTAQGTTDPVNGGTERTAQVTTPARHPQARSSTARSVRASTS